jgi:hypothetical protein
LGLICLGRRLVGAQCPAAHGPDGIKPSATVLNNAPCGQVLAKWLLTSSDIFIFDEPTRRIDVDATAEI